MALSRITNYIEADGADLNLQSSDTTITADSVLGVINFKAPSEASGTDAILLASKIEAIAEGTFSESSNATTLRFFVAKSAAAGSGTDGAVLKFNSDGNLFIKDLDATDGSSPILTFETGDTDIAQDDVLGTINFQAPDEGTGTDAILVASTIKAFSEGDFSSSNNATTLELAVGRSAAAGSDGGRLRLTSAGVLELKNQNTADDSKPILSLQAGDTDIAQGDELGSIIFKAPDEGTGTDAILTAAAIAAESEGDFSSSSNATSLAFATGSSEAATTKMKLSSGGNLSLITDSVELAFGNDSDVKLTHVADTGLILAAGGQTTTNFGTPANGMKDFVIGGDGNVGMSILTTANNNVRLAFGDVDDPDEGQLNYDCNVGTLAFQIDGDQAFKMHNLPDGTFLAAKLEAQGGVTVADEASVTFRAAPGIVVVSNRTNGSSAAYHVDYINSSPTELSDPNSDFRNDDADGFICVIKSSNSYDISVKNRAGASKAISVAVFSIDF